MLSDCFVTTLALTEAVEHTMKNIKNMFGGWGQIKLIEVFVHNTMQVIGDIIVSYQYCGFDRILTQAKEMAGADYASIMNNASRAVLVFVLENPEMRSKIGELRQAVQCVQSATADLDIPIGGGDDDDRGDGDNWENIGADEALEAATAVANCVSIVNEYEIGQLSGVVFASTFNTYNEAE